MRNAKESANLQTDFVYILEYKYKYKYLMQIIQIP